jgi:hypothetical protein
MPNNGDVPGRIEVPGDVDVFTVPTADLDHLIFRVTGVALGMEPRLRILQEDGATEIVAATIDDLICGAPYLALEVQVNGNANLHAEVSHAMDGTGFYQFSAGKRIFSDPPLEVSVDIKPSSCPNPFKLPQDIVEVQGKLPVAILGTEDFDVTTVDPATVKISREGIDGGVSPLRWAYEDVATPFEGELCDCHDLNGDGHMDLTLKFKRKKLAKVLNLYDAAGNTIPLTITGNLYEEFSGTPIRGEDCVRIKVKKIKVKKK